MTSVYQQSVPYLAKSLRALSGLLVKGQSFCTEKGMKPEDMINFRLIADMRGLAYQVQTCCDTAKFFLQRVGNVPNVPVFPDDETTFEELQTRISTTIDLLEKADPGGFEGSEAREILMVTRSMGTFKFETGQYYLSAYVLPNFHFHLTTAYCIMRHLGVPVSAFDYLKDTFTKVE